MSVMFFLLVTLSVSLPLVLSVMTGDGLPPEKHETQNQSNSIPVKDSASDHENETTKGIHQPCQVTDFPDKALNCSSESTAKHVKGKEPKCGANSVLVGDRCLCRDGHEKFPNSDLCVKKQGEFCRFEHNECSTDTTYMFCMNNHCYCESSDLYDLERMQCIGKVGGLCYPGIKDCVDYADCVMVPTRRVIPRSSNSASSTTTSQLLDYVVSLNSDIELSGRCQCKEGYVESEGGLCKKGYGQSCNSGDECDPLNLVCKEGRCDCPDSLRVYDLVSKSCVALVGAQCSDETGGTLCVKLAYCMKTNLKMPGRCACVENAVETNMRMCARAEKIPEVGTPRSIMYFN